MIRTEQIQDLLSSGGNVVGEDGKKIGDIGQVFLDDQTSEPEWVTVKTGMFGGAESFVPLSNADVSGNEIRVPFDKAKVKDAPRVDDSEGHLSQEEEAELYRYYGMDYSESRSDSGLPAGGLGGTDTHDHDGHDHDHDGHDHADRDSNAAVRGTGVAGGTAGTGRSAADADRGAGHDTSGPDTDNAMTRSEEQLNVGTERVSAGKVRLRKYVVTENVTKTVPVSREEVRIEREPITDANRGDATSGGDITSEEHEMELSEDRVVVDKETVPVERVRMDKDVVTDEQTVNEEVRKEQIDTDSDTGTNTGTDTDGTTGRGTR